MIALRSGRQIITVATRRSALAAPLKSLAAPSREAVSRPGVVGRRVAVPKGSSARPSSSSTSGSGGKANDGASKASEAAEGKASEAAEAAAAEKGTPSAEAAAAAAEVSPGTRGSNLLIGLVLLGFATGTYYYTINKMKSQDHLSDVEKEAEEEAMVNLHKSGLKISSKVVPELENKTATEVPAQAAAVVEEVSRAVDAAVEDTGKEDAAPAPAADAADGKRKKKGWRKYWLFGPRVGGD